MVMEYKSGLMVQDTKESGKTIKLTAKESFGTLMAMFSTENGKMTRQMAMESILM
jgi:hypothetical protein